MNGYYKNWYQHYLKEEEQKQKELKKAYYTNIESKVEATTPSVTPTVKDDPPVVTVEKDVKKKRKRFSIFRLFLPLTTVVGFVFLWYYMDVGPIRSIVNEALVVTGLRFETIESVISQEELINKHELFINSLINYVSYTNEEDLRNLNYLYESIKTDHQQLIESGNIRDEETLQAWTFKIFGVHQIVIELQAGLDLTATYEQFINEQRDLANVILGY